MILSNATELYRTFLAMSIGTLMMAACSVLKVHITDRPIYNKVRTARNMLALTYIVVVFFNFAELLLEPGNLILPTFFMTSGMFESLFMVFFLVALINPSLLKWKWLYQHMAVIVSLFIFNLTVTIKSPDHHNPYFFITLIVYGCQLLFFTYFFFRVYFQTTNYLKDYYEENEEIHIKWVRNSFIGLLIIGILTEITTYTNYTFYCLFIIGYVSVYSYIAIGFINRYYKYSKILPAVVEITHKDAPSGNNANQLQSTQLHYNKNRLAMSMDMWITNKGYLQPNVPMEEILKILGTTRPILRSFMKEVYGVDFRNWRNELRLEYAYSLLEHGQEDSIEVVAKKVGFPDTNYFVHSFINKYSIHPKKMLKTKEDFDIEKGL